jgi:hypothetical protein
LLAKGGLGGLGKCVTALHLIHLFPANPASPPKVDSWTAGRGGQAGLGPEGTGTVTHRVRFVTLLLSSYNPKAGANYK